MSKQVIENRIKEMIDILDAGLTKEEFIEAFKKVVELVKQHQATNNETIGSIDTRYSEVVESIKNGTLEDMASLKREALELVADEVKKLGARADEILSKVKDGIDGRDADETVVAEKASILALEMIRPEIPTITQIGMEVPQLGEPIRDALELLQGEERLKLDAIDGVEDMVVNLEKQIKNATVAYVGGSSGGGTADSPLTTKGDVWTYSTVDARLGVGANGTVLTADSGETTGLKWAAAGAGDLKADGTVPLTANWDVGAYKITGTQFESDIATGTAPFVVASTTEVTNLKAATVGTITGLAPDTATTQATQPNITTCANLTTVGTIGTGVWQGTAVDGAYVDIEGTEIKSTGEGGGTKFLREDGDGTCSWQTPSGGGITWSEVTGTTQAMAVDTGYITNNVALVTCTLPDTAALGSVVRISGSGAGGWKLAQNAGETIHFGSTDTTTGVGGSLASVTQYDAVELVCVTANTDWVVISSVGNLTIV